MTKVDGMTIREMQQRVHDLAVRKGWWDNCATNMPFVAMGAEKRLLDVDLVSARIPEKLCLIHSEVSEALEDYRDGKYETKLGAGGKPEGFPTELADVVIRCMDLAGALGIDLEAEIEKKHAFNATRPFRHGGKKV
jgi:NTP pyrophosphatase (non-canonical NTP hydrolase)